MMTIRKAFFVIILSLMLLGYLASQWAWLSASTASYAIKIDEPPIRHAALAVLIAVIIAAIVWPRDHDREEQSK